MRRAALGLDALLEGAEVAADARPAELVVERGGADRALEHDSSSAETMRSGLPRSCSQGCTDPGMRRFDTEKPTRPALGFEPRPVAPSSRISPPEPVAAPGNGEIAVGWLCVSTFIRMSIGSSDAA